MNAAALRALEFDRIANAVAALAITPAGRKQLANLWPHVDAARVVATLRATTEGVRLLADHAALPLRAPIELEQILSGLEIGGRALEPLRLLGLTDFLESIARSRDAIRKLVGPFPLLNRVVDTAASFTNESAEVRRKIDPSGEVADHASPALASIRDRLRRQRQKLRATLDGFVRGRETSKYLQEQVVTDRNGRYVLVVRAEHRTSIPGIVHGASTSGASVFLEPLATVDVNNDIVALEEAEAEEVHRILLALTDAFRARPDDMSRTIDVATELDTIQARALFSQKIAGVEPVISSDSTFELRGARHPLLMTAIWGRESFSEDIPSAGERVSSLNDSRPPYSPVPVDILLTPPTRVLVIAGPNTGGKTVALKTAGLLAVMAQAGLHIPVDPGSQLPIFRSLFADIGDEQSISASLSTFSAHVANVVSMDRHLLLPALVLLDEVGAGTDPIEGGALGMAVIDHFRTRGAHLIATTHDDALKSYAATTDGVISAAFGFTPETFAPTYQLLYKSPGRSLALEIAARHGMPTSVIVAARANIAGRESQLAAHLAKVDEDLRGLQRERAQVTRERMAMADAERKLRHREETLREREDAHKRRVSTKLDERIRNARQEIDSVIGDLKTRVGRLSKQPSISTGDAGAARVDARAALERIVSGASAAAQIDVAVPEPETAAIALAPGVRVMVAPFGFDGVVVELNGRQAEVEVRGKRLRTTIDNLRPTGIAVKKAAVNVNVALQPRDGLLSELNVIGCTVDEALTRTERFIDESTMTDRQNLRIVHGHGTGQLRRAIAELLKNHPLVSSYALAPQEQGGGGATIVELKD